MSNSISDIKNSAQNLDTSIVQWLNSNPPEHIQTKLNEAREHLHRGQELSEAPLRIALVGEFNSGKTLLLNSLLDSTNLFPCLLKPTTGNVLEVRVNLRKEERPAEIKGSSVSFFTKFEIENVLQQYLLDLTAKGIDGLPKSVELGAVEPFERLLCKKFQEVTSITLKYSIVAALEFLISLRSNRDLVVRDDRQEASLPTDLISTALTLRDRPDLNLGIQNIYNSLKQTYTKQAQGGNVSKITSKNLRPLFPLMRRVMVDVSAWCVPFGVDDPSLCSSIAFLDFPGLGAESSSARDYYLCTTEIRDAHCVLVVFNGANPGTSGASTMANLFREAGKLTTDRTIIAVNRFDEFHPLPTGRSSDSYYSTIQDGTNIGFATVQVPAKNLMSGNAKKVNLYLCSALCYLFEEKAERPNWNFGNARWFDDNKRQGAFTLYKRCGEDFRKIIDEVNASRTSHSDHVVMKEGLEKYTFKGGVPRLREDMIKFAMSQGERLIREDSLKEIRAAARILDDIAPALVDENDTSGSINPEVSYAAQEFYRVLELAVADTLPSGPSEYKQLKVRSVDEDVSLWDAVASEIAASVCSWPEWFAIMNNQGSSKKNARPGAASGKRFGRYAKIKKPAGEVPESFNAFDQRFKETGEQLTQQTLEEISKAIIYSIHRFEAHPDYQDAISTLQGMINVNQLPEMEEALPLLDVWSPSQLAETDIAPMVQERIEEEIAAIQELSYPYDGAKPCGDWNLALVIRVQVQLVKTYRDKISRLVAASENEFQNFFCNEVLRAEILPLVRSALNNPDFLGEVALSDGGVTWEGTGQVVRSAVNKFKEGDGPKSLASMIPKQNSQAAPSDNASSGSGAAAMAGGAAVGAAAASATTGGASDEFEDDFEDDFESAQAEESPSAASADAAPEEKTVDTSSAPDFFEEEEDDNSLVQDSAKSKNHSPAIESEPEDSFQEFEEW